MSKTIFFAKVTNRGGSCKQTFYSDDYETEREAYAAGWKLMHEHFCPGSADITVIIHSDEEEEQK